MPENLNKRITLVDFSIFYSNGPVNNPSAQHSNKKEVAFINLSTKR